MDSKDIEKLNILLSHWIEHNESHIRSYNDWAAKLAAGGMMEVGGKIGEAAETIALANEKFKQAKDAFEALEKREED